MPSRLVLGMSVRRPPNFLRDHRLFLPFFNNGRTHFVAFFTRFQSNANPNQQSPFVIDPQLNNSISKNVCSAEPIARFSRTVDKVMDNITQDGDLEAGLDGLGLKSITPGLVTEILRNIQRRFFREGKSQRARRSPIVQRCLWKEVQAVEPNQTLRGHAARRNPLLVKQGVEKALRFYLWVEGQVGFFHTQITCQEMAWTLARANHLKMLWRFLHEMSGKRNGLVTTKTLTSVIRVLGEEGLVNEALSSFYRMKQFHCKPDLIAYNNIILALCRVGNFKKARLLLDQMQMPGSKCTPDTYTYTILIACYCSHSMQTQIRKVANRRLQEANRLFREMGHKGFVPDVVTYNCLIDCHCKRHKFDRALELFEQMSLDGCHPNKVTYNSFIRYYSTVGETDKASMMLNDMKSKSNIHPTCSSYTPIVHALCRGGRLEEACEFLIEMVEGKSIPRTYTYKLVTDELRKAGKAALPAELCRKVELGIESRADYAKRVKNSM